MEILWNNFCSPHQLSPHLLFSFFLLGRGQALSFCQVVHSDGQEDIEEDV